jgi:hypothetical protein
LCCCVCHTTCTRASWSTSMPSGYLEEAHSESDEPKSRVRVGVSLDIRPRLRRPGSERRVRADCAAAFRSGQVRSESGQVLVYYSAKIIAKSLLVLSRGREDFSTQSRICLGSRARTWQIANHKRRRGGVGTLLLSWVWDCSCKIFVSRRGGFALESGPRATFGKKHGFKFL